MPRRVVLLVIALALPVFADEPDWRDVVVRFTIGTEGELHVREQLRVEVPAGVKRLERRYWTDAEQHVRLDRVMLVDARGSTIELRDASEPSDGTIRWSTDSASEARLMTYIVETTVTGAVIPSWSLGRGRQTHDDQHQLADPLPRLAALVAQWRRAKRDRYLLDYSYEMPPPSTTGTTIQLQLYWPDGWKPVDELTGDNIGKPVDRNFYDPDSWRVTHFFDVRGHAPANIDLRMHALRMLAVLGFPIVALLLVVVFALRRRTPPPASGEAPEVLIARATGRAPFPAIEPFLRGLEAQRKLAIDIEERGEDDDPLVRLRLLAGRDKLTPYERAGIDALMPDGWDTTSDDVRKRHEGGDFDPADALHAYLEGVAAQSNAAKPPWPLRVVTYALFIAGVILLGLESTRLGREPAALAATLIAASMLHSITRIRHRAVAVVVTLLAIAVVFAINVAGELPLGIYAASGLSLVMLAVIVSALRPLPPLPPRAQPFSGEEWGAAFQTYS